MIKATVNLNKIKQNALVVKGYIGGKKLCAVVKSNAYGHGLCEVANALYGIADYYAVASVKEGVKLKYAGIDTPILVLVPTKEIALAVRFGLDITVCDYHTLVVASNIAKCLKKSITVHIKYDTGMHRFGLNNLAELEKCLFFIRRNGHVKLGGIYSHFSNAIDAEKTRKQFLAFATPCLAVKKLFPNAIRHISASGGIITNANYTLDMVRVGLLLYGYPPFDNDKITVNPAMTVTTNVVGHRQVNGGDTFLYGNNVQAKSITTTLLDYGYADGFSYSDSGVVGNRCMNTCAVKGNFTGEYTLLNGSQQLQELVFLRNSIPYEVLTSITKNACFEYIDN